MMAGSHMVLGAGAWVVAASLSGLPPAEPVALATAVAGSLLPDLDHPQSWAGRRLKPLSVPLSMLLGHRGLTHSLLAVLGCVVALDRLGTGHGAAPLVVGYLSHLAADGLTPSGVPLLWPLRHRFALPLCRTGGFMEMAVVAALTAAAVWYGGLIPPGTLR
jgi:inner membrane protein